MEWLRYARVEGSLMVVQLICDDPKLTGQSKAHNFWFGRADSAPARGGCGRAMKRKCAVFCVVLAVALSSCVTTTRQERMANALDEFVGESVASFVALHGEPTSFVKTGDNEAAFRWVITGPGVGGIVPIGNSLVVVPAGQRVCTIVLTAASKAKNPEYKDWAVTRWHWEGAC
jgi:hypothetical protein